LHYRLRHLQSLQSLLRLPGLHVPQRQY